MEDDRPKRRSLEDYWRPRLELVSKQPKKKEAP